MEMPIRILQFPGSMLFGGVGSVIMNLYRNIDRTKIQFDFCVPRTEHGPLDDEIESMGGRVFYIPQMRKQGFRYYINSICKIIREHGPYQYAHIHSIHMGAITLLATKKMKLKTIYHAHNTQDPALENVPIHLFLELLLKKIIQNRADYRLSCGQNAGQYIYGKKSFIVINNAIDLKVFYPYNNIIRKGIRSEFNLKEDDIVVGDVARFCTVKNIAFFIQLAKADRKKNDKIKFLLVGDGEEKPKIEREIRELCLDDKFILTGSRKDVDRLYNVMDIFCLPSLYEGLPVSLMEAQAIGLPCVISDTITQEGVVGPSEVRALSLLSDADLWIKSFYELSNNRITDANHIFNSFCSRKYEISSIAQEIEMLYLNKL